MKIKFCSPILLLPFISPVKADLKHELEPLIVSTPIHKKAAETIYPVNVLTGQDLLLKQGTTIGETLKQELGIHSSSFGSSVGRPVIRGQVGTRVQVLQNGISSLDVADLSPDHANSTEGLFARQIEVLRGPASLLYGSGAIGGVVNVIDNRIPMALPESASGSFQQRYNSASEQWTNALEYDGGFDKWAWHIDGFFRDSGDYDVPTRSNGTGFVENTDARSWSGTVGSSLIGDWGAVGFSVNHLDNNYGVPPVDELVRIDVEQTRYDLKGELYEPFDWAKVLKFRFAYNDYQHAELEDGVTVGTVFDNEAMEGRVELVHYQFGFFDHGSLGIQVQDREFTASGEEAFVPPSTVLNYAFFVVEDIHAGDLAYEVGLRIEHQEIDADGFKRKQHTPVNASISALWHATDDTMLSLAFTHAQRAPTVQELFSEGAHHATETFEFGDENLELEKSYNLEFGLKAEFQSFSTEINLFHNWSEDYIFQENTGLHFDLATETIGATCAGDCLPVLQAVQKDARFYGFESLVSFPLWAQGSNKLDAGLFADYVRGKLTSRGNVPRMPPLRYGIQLDYANDKNISAGLRLTRAESQSHTGENETSTNDYLLLNANISYNWKFSNNSHALLFVKGNNLLNETIRNATSFLKDVAPEPGRGAELGIKITF